MELFALMLVTLMMLGIGVFANDGGETRSSGLPSSRRAD